jgi:hypothetical protein
MASASHAAAMPSTLCSNCHMISGRSGEAKFRQFVMARGRPPAQTTLRAASATAIAPPRKGSSCP